MDWEESRDMLCRELDRLEIKHRAWLKAKRLVGTIVFLSTLLGVEARRVSKWLSQPRTRIPYEYAVRTALLTGISLDSLSPFTTEINKFFKNLEVTIESLKAPFCLDLDSIATQYRAWQEVKELLGSTAALNRMLKLHPRRVSKWFKNPKIVPYEYAIKTALLTNVSLDRLSPFTQDINEFFKNPVFNFELSLEPVSVSTLPYLKDDDSNRLMIVDSHRQLISGFAQKKLYKTRGIKKTQVIVVDIEALWLELKTLDDIYPYFLISDRVAIGLYLEQILGSHQGQRTDLGYGTQKNNQSDVECCSKWDEVVGRKDEKIARLLGFSSKTTYHRAKQVYLQGNLELIRALDKGELSIAKAAKHADFLKHSLQPETGE